MKLYWIATICFLLGWFIAEVGWWSAQYHRRQFSAYHLPDVRSRQQAFQCGRIPTSTSTECQPDNLRLQSQLKIKTSIENFDDLIFIETLHELIIVISSAIIATAWVTVLTIILNSRIQRRLDRRLLAMYHQRDPYEEFRSQRRQG